VLSGRQLAQFVAVAEELHVGHAAARLGMAQSPLSQAIRALELKVGVSLFQRRGRGISLTSAGAVFLAEARSLLLQEEQAIRRARWAQDGGSHRLTLGFVGSLGYTVLPGIVRRFHAAHPGIQLSIAESSSTTQLDALRAGRLDLGIIRAQPRDESLRFRTIARERMMMAMPRTHPLAKSRAPTLADFASDKFVLFSPPGPAPMHAMLMDACREAGFEPSFDYEVQYLPSAVGVVASGAAVALLPAGLSEIRHHDVVFRPLAGAGRRLFFDALAAWSVANSNPSLERLLATLPS
jgi:DNA-binding transcriptional LysR family regulator